MTQSSPVKIVALAGLVCVLAFGGVAFLLVQHRHSSTADVVVRTSHARPAPQAPAPAPKTPVAPVVDEALPAPLRRALLASPVAVAVLYAPGVAADADVVTAARRGASATGTAFVALDVTSTPVANALHAWLPAAGDPAVLVVKRPGTVFVELDGWSDASMVAQAAATAR